MTVVRHQRFPQKPPSSSLWFSRTGVQPSPGSSTIALPSAFAESGAYPPNRALPGSPRQCCLPLACRHPPEGHQIGVQKRRVPGNTILSQPYLCRVSTDRRIATTVNWRHFLRVSPALHPPERPSNPHTPKPGFRREMARDKVCYCAFNATYKLSPKRMTYHFNSRSRVFLDIRLLNEECGKTCSYSTCQEYNGQWY